MLIRENCIWLPNDGCEWSGLPRGYETTTVLH